jgi:cation transport ATPase
MTMLATVLRMLVGLFVDDGSLALAIIVIVLLSWIVATLMPDWPLAAGAVLLVGCPSALLANVMKAAER